MLGAEFFPIVSPVLQQHLKLKTILTTSIPLGSPSKPPNKMEHVELAELFVGYFPLAPH